jgi:peptidoglycan/xylan/chitin deacetylase (PgdA/CDA1 family)
MHEQISVSTIHHAACSTLAMLLIGSLRCAGSSPEEGKGGAGGNGSGGVTGTGGTQEIGGTKGSEGAGSTGGFVGTGGLAGTGGSVGSGSARATGGSTASGGRSGSGGGVTGGASGTGATEATGGKTGGGGATAKGGVGGGSSATTAAGGGSTGTDGGVGVITGSPYPPAGVSGQAKPTGAGLKVTVLDWAGFKGAVSFNFDDTSSTQIDHYKELQAINDKGNNVHYTFYLQTGKTGADRKTWAQAVNDGHELGNHTKNHASSGDTATLAADADAARTFIKNTFGVTAYSLAAPGGYSGYAAVAKGKFLTNRSAANTPAGVAPTDNPDPLAYNLPCFLPAASASASSMEAPIKTAVNGGKWQLLLIHGFAPSGDYNPVDIKEFTSTVSWAKSQGNIWIDSVVNVSAYWIAQYRFSKLTPTTSGTETTWTWKITDFSNPFPPGKYLRVTTDGGTLRQGGSTLTWDDHGYYEVSLDAGTLTLAP